MAIPYYYTFNNLCFKKLSAFSTCPAKGTHLQKSFEYVSTKFLAKIPSHLKKIFSTNFKNSFDIIFCFKL